MIQERINLDLQGAMKAKNELRVSVLRMLRGALLDATIAQKREALSEDQELEVLRREAKKIRDAIADYTRGGRQDLARRAEQEIAIIAAYLPQQMDEEAVREVVKTKIAELGASSASDFGRVVGAVMKDLKGRADGSVVARLVREALAK
ncbi:MAG: GatB/YqeY domain-containing protein [Patescibacteria group bacterium]